MIQVHITEDQKLMVELLTLLINDSGVATVSGKSYTLTECMDALEQYTPDVLLLDIGLPDGNSNDYCVRLCKKFPTVKILVLTTYKDYSLVRQVLNAGVSGYILKDAPAEELIEGIAAVMEGEIYLCRTIDRLVNSTREEMISLTFSEKEVLQLIAEGYTNKQIAEKMYRSPGTIETHHKVLNRKFNVTNNVELVNKAKKMKLVFLPE